MAGPFFDGAFFGGGFFSGEVVAKPAFGRQFGRKKKGLTKREVSELENRWLGREPVQPEVVVPVAPAPEIAPRPDEYEVEVSTAFGLSNDHEAGIEFAGEGVSTFAVSPDNRSAVEYSHIGEVHVVSMLPDGKAGLEANIEAESEITLSVQSDSHGELWLEKPITREEAAEAIRASKLTKK